MGSPQQELLVRFLLGFLLPDVARLRLEGYFDIALAQERLFLLANRCHPIHSFLA